MPLITIHDDRTGYVVEADFGENGVDLSFFDDPRLPTREAVNGISLSPQVTEVLAGVLAQLAHVVKNT